MKCSPPITNYTPKDLIKVSLSADLIRCRMIMTDFRLDCLIIDDFNWTAYVVPFESI